MPDAHPKLNGLIVVALMAFAVAAAAQTPAQTATATRPPMLSPGDHVPEFDTTDLAGATKHVVYPKGRVTVLLFFMSSCHVCHGMIPEWNRAYERRASNVDILGVMVDEAPAAFLATLNIEFPIVHARADLRDRFKVYQVPQTMRVLDGGRVEDLSLGHIDAMRLGELVRPPAAGEARPAKAAKTKAP
jgi:hypothetical protein